MSSEVATFLLTLLIAVSGWLVAIYLQRQNIENQNKATKENLRFKRRTDFLTTRLQEIDTFLQEEYTLMQKIMKFKLELITGNDVSSFDKKLEEIYDIQLDANNKALLIQNLGDDELTKLQIDLYKILQKEVKSIHSIRNQIKGYEQFDLISESGKMDAFEEEVTEIIKFMRKRVDELSGIN